MKMSSSLYSLIPKINSLKRFALPVRRQFHRSFECQSSLARVDDQFCKFSKPLVEILDTVPPESEALSPSDALNILRSLSKQPKSSYNVANHRNFNILCQALKSSMPYFETNGKLHILNAIQHLCVPIDSEIYHTVLASFHENLFNMSLNEIMILDRVLCSGQKNQMADDLHRSLVDQFNLKSSKLKTEYNYFMRMRRMLQFIQRNRYEIAEEVFGNMGSTAKQNVDILTAYEATDIIILLSNFGDRNGYVWPILDKAFDVWCNGAVTMRMVEIVLKILVRRNSYNNDVSRFSDRRFIETCTRTAIATGDIEKCFLILRYLNELEFISERLIDFLLNHLKDNQKHKDFVHNCALIATACDIGNYKSPLFYDFLLPLLSATNFHQQLDFHLNWPKLALTLLNLGIRHQPLINEILKRRSQFQTNQGFDALECLEMQRMINVDVQPLLPDIKNAMGKHIRLLACIDEDIVVPMLVKIDTHSKKLLSFEDDKNVSMNSWHCHDGQLLIALVGPDSQNFRPLRSNVITIALDPNEWTELLQLRTHRALYNDIYNNRIIKQTLDLK